MATNVSKTPSNSLLEGPPVRRIVLVVFVSIALPLAGCTDTTPVSQGSGEGVLIFNIETGDEQQMPDVRIDFTPEPDTFGAIMMVGDVITYREFPVGEYVASVKAPGYEDVEVDIEVTQGETSEHDVTLQPEG